MSTGGDRDDILETYLEGGSELSRAYREEAREEPPAHLDRRIRLAAHHGMRSVRGAHGPFARSWAVPVSLAAVLVLSVSVVLLMSPPDAVDPTPSELPSTAAPSPGLGDGRGNGRVSGQGAGQGAGEKAGAPYSTDELRREAQRPRESAEPLGAEPPAAASGAARERAPTPEPGDALPATPAPRFAPAPAPSTSAPRRLDGADLMKEEAERTPRQHAPAAPASAGDGALDLARPPRVGTEKRAAPSAAQREADPQAWLRAIEALLDEGDTAAARAELAAFIAAYPGHPLGERLQALREGDPGLERAGEPQ